MFRLRRSSLWYWCACLALAGLPFLQAEAAARAAFGRTLSDFTPVLNDEVAYWHEVATFARAGFGGGYYSYEETPAAVGRFGTHGAGFAVVYGSIARLTGWYRDTGPRFNAAAVGAGLMLFALVSGAPVRHVALLGLVVATFWPVAFFVPSTMQEPLHYGAALALGGLMARGLDGTGRLRPALEMAGWLLAAGLVFIRPSWAIALGSWAIAAGGGSLRGTAVRVVLAMGVAAGATVAFFQTAAPIPQSSVTASSFMLAGGLEPISARIAENAARLVDLQDFERIELWHRAVYLAAAAASVVAFAVAVARRRPSRHALVHVVNLCGIVAAMLVMYAFSNMTGFRIIAAHVLLSAAVLAARPTRAARVALAALVVASLAAGGVFWDDYRQNRDANFRRDLRVLRLVEEAIEGKMTFEPGADPWCNTLLAAQFPPDLIAVPAGIGLSALADPERLRLPMKSRYVLLDERTRGLADGALMLEHAADLPYGSLYINRSAACGPNAAPPLS